MRATSTTATNQLLPTELVRAGRLVLHRAFPQIPHMPRQRLLEQMRRVQARRAG